MNPNRQAEVVPLMIQEVPLPNYPLIIPPKGTVWLRGELTEPVDQYKLEDHLLPPGIYKTVRDDLARYSPLKCSRIALTKHELEYIGVIDSDGDPYYFVLNSLGMRTSKADDKDEAWEAFNELMDRERKAGLEYMRDRTASDLDLYISKADKPYGHVAYSRTVNGKTVQVKAKGIKPGDHHVVDTNPFHPETDDVAHAAHEHLKKHKPTKGEDVLDHLERVAIDHGSEDPIKDAKRLYKYLVSHKSFTFDAAKFDSPDVRAKYNAKALAKAMGAKAFTGKLDQRYAQIGVVRLKYRAPRKQLEISNQKTIRDQFRNIVQGHGALDRDITNGNELNSKTYLIRNLGKYTQGVHSFTGWMAVAPNVHAKASQFMSRRAADPSVIADPEETKCLNVYIHETLHGCSPTYLGPEAYKTKEGAQLEEVTTELAARMITAKEFGASTKDTGTTALNDAMSSIHQGTGPYGHWIKHAFEVVHAEFNKDMQRTGEATDWMGTIQKMFDACMAVKADTRELPAFDRSAGWVRVNMATETFVKALTKDPAQQASLMLKLWKQHSGPLGKGLRDDQIIPFIEAIKTYAALAKRGKLKEWEGEYYAMLSGDVDLATKFFDHIDSGEPLPEGWEQQMMPYSLAKALAKKDNTGKDKDAKKTKSVKASSKKAGKNGKTRYNYPEDKKPQGKGGKGKPGDKKPAPGEQKAADQAITPQQDVEESGADPIAVPRPPQPKSVDPQKMANQMQIPVHTLQHIAKRFVKNSKLGGRKGFQQFMKTRLRDFAEKHKLDGDYFGLLYDALVGAKPTVATTV